MKASPETLDFVKAMAHTDRLKIIGLLTDHPAGLDELAAGLSLPVRKVFNHLAFMQHVGVVHEQAGTYALDIERVEQLGRQQFTRDQAGQQGSPLGERWKPISAFLNRDGTIARVPNSRTQSARFRMMLDYLMTAFASERIYTEKEVNAIIRNYHEDTAGLRRDLVDAGLLGRERDGSRYWCIPQDPGMARHE